MRNSLTINCKLQDFRAQNLSNLESFRALNTSNLATGTTFFFANTSLSQTVLIIVPPSPCLAAGGNTGIENSIYFVYILVVFFRKLTYFDSNSKQNITFVIMFNHLIKCINGHQSLF